MSTNDTTLTALKNLLDAAIAANTVIQNVRPDGQIAYDLARRIGEAMAVVNPGPRKFTNNQNVRIAGSLEHLYIFTAEGYARKYGEDPAAALARCRERNEIDACLQPAATVITAEGNGMAAWANAPVVEVGEVIEVDGVTMKIEAPRKFESGHYRLTRIEREASAPADNSTVETNDYACS